MSVTKSTIKALALRTAAAHRGRVYPADLLRWLPISLELAEEHLRGMADGYLIRATEHDGWLVFEFADYVDDPPGPVEIGGLFGELSDGSGRPVWPADDDRLGGEIRALGSQGDWLVRAARQHELLFITAPARGPVGVERIASRSRLSRREVDADLRRLAERKFIRAAGGQPNGDTEFEFPPLVYNRDAFQRNDGFLRLHPATIRSEFLRRLRWLLISLTGILLVCLGLSIFRVPFPALLLGGLMASLVIAIRIFTHTTRITPEQL